MMVFAMVMLACGGATGTTAADDGLAQLRAGDAASAAESFTEAVNAGAHDPMVFHGLGNALHRLNKPGPAVAAWRRGLALEPRNGDIVANIELVSRSMEDRVDAPPTHRSAFFWQAMLSPLETAMAASALLSIALWWLVVGRIRPSLQPSRAVVSACLVVAFLLVASTWDALQHRRSAVIAVAEVDVRSALGPSGVTLFTLHEGATVVVADTTETHWLITLTDGRKGWLNRRALISTVPSDPFELPDG